MKLRFSTHPGCWERHLQRQYNNPLFLHHADPSITPQEVEKAQRKDKQERQDFEQAFQTLLKEVAALESQVEVKIIHKLKSRIDSLYEQCAGLGKDFSEEKQGLRELNELIMQAVWASSTLDPQTQAELETEAAARQMHFSLLEHSLIAHLLRPDSPITEKNIVPTLLTEEEAPLRAAMSLFDNQQQQILCQEARNLLTQLKKEDHKLPAAWIRLAIMEQPLYRPN